MRLRPLHALFAVALAATPAMAQVTQGSLQIAVDPAKPPAEGELRELPLLHTDVRAEVTGFISRVTVTQTFHNPSPSPIEAVYVFPLPTNAAVGALSIKLGGRTIRGIVQTRDQARKTYQAAKASGRRAALLEQERANVFTQSVTGILPGDKIDIEIVYDAEVGYADGAYQLVFPMVVGPRYHPASVADAGRGSPPLLPPGSRSGSDISLTAVVRPGAPLAALDSPSHHILDSGVRAGLSRTVTLSPEDSIPNKDFVLRWRLSDDQPVVALATEAGPRGGHFALLIDPPRAPAPTMIAPREVIFVVDTSGSMNGEPLSIVKAAMRVALKKLLPGDSFNIINFSTDAGLMASAPLPATPDNVRRGLSWVNGLGSGGGTEMLSGIRAALGGAQPAAGRLRVVCFMTDGYIGNEREVAAEVTRLLGEHTRLFAFGIGSSVNRLLLDWLAEAGRGSAQYILLGQPAEPQIDAFYARIAAPVLTDVSIDWGSAKVADVTPAKLPDLWLGQPLRVTGRVSAAGSLQIRIGARLAGKQIWYPVRLELPAAVADSDSDAGPAGPLARIWARAQISDLERPRMGQVPVPYQARITELALAHQLVSTYTSFVAVEDQVVIENGAPRTVQVPVEVPEGVNYRNVSSGGDGSAPTSTPADAPPSPERGGDEDDSEGAPTASTDRFRDWDDTLARRWHIGVGFGAGSMGASDFDSSVTTAYHLRISRDVARLMALGVDATLLRAGPEYTSVQGLAEALLGLTKRLRLIIGLGIGVPDGHSELAAVIGAEYLVHYGPINFGLSARLDLTAPGNDGQSMRAMTGGLYVEW